MPIRNWISESIILPLSDVFLGKNITEYLIFLKKSQYWSKKELKDYQNKKLQLLITHSYKNVPYYKELFDKLKIVPSDIKTTEDLFKLPILTKAEIKLQGIEKFTSTSFAKKNLIKTGSSGSTGEPLYYYITKDAVSMNTAASLRGWNWMGYRLGDKYIKISQNPRQNRLKVLQDKISRNKYLASNPLQERNYKYILESIENYQPKIIRSYPDPLLFLARYKQKYPEFKYRPLAVTTTGNTLHPETRKEIEDAFGCRIFDTYSCEGNSNVFECPSHECYHSSEEYGISEIVDDSGKRINDGIGRLISTDLCNFAHPFIRYDTQDLVEVSSDSCSCGRNLLRINRIIGRDNDIITNATGQKFIVHNFTGFFQIDHPELHKAVDHFQVIKTKEGIIVFNLVVNKNYSASVESFIVSYWKAQLKYPIRINIVKEIRLTNSGKRRFIINEE